MKEYNLVPLIKNLYLDEILFDINNNIFKFNIRDLLNLYNTNKFFRELLDKKLDKYPLKNYEDIENCLNNNYDYNKKIKYSIGSECWDIYNSRILNKNGIFHYMNSDQYYNLLKVQYLSNFLWQMPNFSKEQMIRDDNEIEFNYPHSSIQDTLTGFVKEFDLSKDEVLYHSCLVCCPFKDTYKITASTNIHECIGYAKYILRIKLRKNTKARYMGKYDTMKTYGVAFPPMSRFKIIDKSLKTEKIKCGRSCDSTQYIYKPTIYLQEI